MRINNFKYIYKFFAIILWLPISCYCTEEVRDIDISQAVEMALMSNRDMKIKCNEVYKDLSTHEESKSNLRPQVSFSVNWLYNMDYPNIIQTTFVDDYNLAVKAEVKQIITTFGKLKHAIKSAKHKYQAALYEEKALTNNVIYGAKMKFNSLILAENISRIREMSYGNALKNKLILEERSEGGRSSKHDNIKISADIFSRVSPMQEASSAYIKALDNFKDFVGLASDDEINLVKESNPMPCNCLNEKLMADRMMKNNPLIKVFSEIIVLGDEVIKSKKAEYYPSLVAYGAWQSKGSSSDHYYVGSNNLRNYTETGVSLTAPIYNGGKRKQELLRAKLDKENSVLHFEKVKSDLQLELSLAIKEYNNYLKIIEADKYSVSLAEEAFMLAQELFKSGQISVTDLNDAEFMLTNQKIKQEYNLFGIRSIAVNIEKLTGESL